MKVIIFLLLLMVYLSKQRSDYKIIVERVETVSLDPRLFNVTSTYRKFNRTETVVSVNFTFNFVIRQDNVDVRFRGYQLFGNAYKLTAIQTELPLCSELETNLHGLDQVYSHSNITTCPMFPGPYYIKDYCPSEEKFPDRLPFGSFMAEFAYMLYKKPFAFMRWYAKVERIIRWNK